MADPTRSKHVRQRARALDTATDALRRHWPWLVWLAGPICYGLGLLGAATSEGVAWRETAWFDTAWFDAAQFDHLRDDEVWHQPTRADGAGPGRFGLETIRKPARNLGGRGWSAAKPRQTGPWLPFGPATATQTVFSDSLLGRAAAGALMAAGAAWLLVGGPWILGSRAIARRFPQRGHPGAWSLAVNCLALMALITLLRMSVGVGRWGLLAGWLGWGLLLAWLARPQTTSATRNERLSRPGADRGWWVEAVAVLIALGGVAAAMVWFGREWLLQCHSGDGTEASVLARSLREHLLPYFEVESLGEPGFVVGSPTLVNSYWTCAFQALLGGSEATARLPFWIWCLAIAAMGSSMLARGPAPVRWSAAAVWGLTGFLWCLWYSFYTGYYPYLADPAAPGVPDALFALLLLVALDALRREDLGAWVVLMVLASVVLYAGPVMFVLTGAAALVWRPVARRPMWRAIGWGSAALAGVLGFYVVCGLADGSFWGWPETIYSEYVADFIAPGARWSSGWRYLGCFVLGCGGLGCVGLVTAFLPHRGSRHTEGADDRTRAEVKPGQTARRERRASEAHARGWQRATATLVLGYLLIVLVSGGKNLHYLGPIIPPAVILWLRELCRWPSPRRAQMAIWATVAGMAGAIVLCWPQARPVFTLNRQLGALSTFQTRSVWEAYRWARLSEPLYQRGLLSWQVGPHTWADYAQLSVRPARHRPLLVTDREPPRAYQLVLRSEAGAALYVAHARFEQWLRQPRPAGTAERFPWVFRWLLLGKPGFLGPEEPSAAGAAG